MEKLYPRILRGGNQYSNPSRKSFICSWNYHRKFISQLLFLQKRNNAILLKYLDFYKTFGSDHIEADTELFHYDDFDQERIDQQRFPTALQQIKWKQFHYQLISHGCLIHNQLHNQVTHVILVDEEELKMVERYGFVLERLLAMGKSAKDVQIVSIKWLEESLKLNTLIPILDEFQINKLLS